MGRRKSYDRDEIVGKAMELFRDHGFAGTSADMLVGKLGINRYSLYAEFGNKQGLFEAALKRYDAEVIGARFGPLELPDAGLAEIHKLLDFYGAAGRGPAAGRGCLLCNTAVEFGPEDPGGAGFVERYFARLKSAFTNALTNARDRGEVDQNINLDGEVSHLTSAVLGLFVMIRAKAAAETISDAASSVTAHLEALRPQSQLG